MMPLLVDGLINIDKWLGSPGMPCSSETRECQVGCIFQHPDDMYEFHQVPYQCCFDL